MDYEGLMKQQKQCQIQTRARENLQRIREKKQKGYNYYLAPSINRQKKIKILTPPVVKFQIKLTETNATYKIMKIMVKIKS